VEQATGTAGFINNKNKGKTEMKTLAIWFGKRYVLGLVQDAVSAKEEKVAEWAVRIGIWIERIGYVVKFFGSLADKLADGEITSAEAESAVREAKSLAEAVTKDVSVAEVK
jgi:hypothetical protein